MKNLNKIFLLIFFLPFTLFAQTKEDMVAKINGEPVLKSDLEKAIMAVEEQYAQISPELLSKTQKQDSIRKMAFDKIESEMLIKQEAARLKIKVSEREIDNGINEVKSRFYVDQKGNKLSQEQAEKNFMDELKNQNMSYEEFREKIKKDLMARKLIDQVLKPKVNPPTEQEQRNFFNNIMLVINGSSGTIKASKEEIDDYINIASKLKEVFAERIRLRHILIKLEKDDLLSKNKAFEKAKAIRERILKGEDFEEVAEKESDDRETAKRGGDIGYVIKGMLPEELEKVAFSINPGDISDVIESNFGYHIIQVTEKRISQKIKFDLIKDDIVNIMMQQRFAKELEKYVDDLKKKAKIEIFDSSLK